MTVARFCRLLLVGLAALLAFVPIAPARATAPDIQRFREEGTDLHLMDCGTFFFFINGQYKLNVSVTTFFDQVGNPVRIKVHVVFDGQLTNETTGETLRDATRDTVFVDVQTGTLTFVGLPVHWTIPGVGRILLDAGKIAFDPSTGEVSFEAGPHPFFYLTEEERDALLCSALAAP